MTNSGGLLSQRRAEKLEPVRGGFRFRLRFGRLGRHWITICASSEAEASKRRDQLTDTARMLISAGHAEEAIGITKRSGIATDIATIRELRAIADGLCKGRIPTRKVDGQHTTFRTLGERWTSGGLHEAHPDQLKLKRTADEDRRTLEKHVYPVIGSKPIASITLDDAEDVMRGLPQGLSPLTRRNIGHLMVRLFKLAVYPLRLIEASPIPTGFLPRRGQRKALAYLYPDEVRRLLECRDVPLSFRLLWGFLACEGMREGEALALTWADLDLKRGAVRLDKNKTDDPRAWALDPGTTAALVRYHDTMRPNAKPDELVFVDPQGNAHSKYGIAMLLRSHLEAVGLKKERPELFITTNERQQIRVHDLRGTFVTVSLANGRSESWISDRTGHRSSTMINRYKRASRSFQEIGLGPLTPLGDAIPEFNAPRGGPRDAPRRGPQGGTRRTKTAEKRASPTGFEPVSQP